MEQVQVHQIITEVTVCALPIEPGHGTEYEVSVIWRHDDSYTVEHGGSQTPARFYTPAGMWDRYGGQDRDGPWEQWLQAHQYPYFEALGLARQACQTITVDGLTAADVLAKQEKTK